MTQREIKEIFPNEFDPGLTLPTPEASPYSRMWRRIEDDEPFVRCCYSNFDRHLQFCGKIALVVTINGYLRYGLCEQHSPEEKNIIDD